MSRTPEEGSLEFVEWLDEQATLARMAFESGGGSTHWDPTIFPRAKNVIDWVTNPEFLGRTTLYDYPRQYQILRDTHELLCPYCNDLPSVVDCWGRSPADMRKDVLLEFGECPVCHRTRRDLVKDQLIEDIDEVVLIIGMRGGKTTVIGTYDQTYMAHVYLTLKDPIRYFGLDPSSTLEAGFFSASKEQTLATVWAYFTSTLYATTWYQSYVDALKRFSEERRIPLDLTYRSLGTAIHIYPQYTRFCAYHSNTAATAGRTRFSVVIDEMGMYLHQTGDEVHNVTRASLRTLLAARTQCYARGDTNPPPVRMVEFGTPGPIKRNDPLERRFAAVSSAPIPRVYALRLPTWMMNPNITRESLESEFLTDPIKSQRQYGAESLDSESVFFQKHLLTGAFNPSERAAIVWAPNVRIVQTDDGAKVHYSEVVVEQVRLGMGDGPLLVVGDAGEKKDRFGLAVSRVVSTGDSTRVRIEGLIQITPSTLDTRAGKIATEVYYPCVLSIIKRLHQTCHVGLVVFDRWDSTYILQEIRNLGIPAMKQNIREEDYILARGEFRSGRVEIPCLSPAYCSHSYTNLKHELEELQQSPEGRVDHPRGGHNDLAQVVCHSISISLSSLMDTVAKARKESGLRSSPQIPARGARVVPFHPASFAAHMATLQGAPGEMPKMYSRLLRNKTRR